MARKQVIQVECGRCERKELLEVEELRQQSSRTFDADLCGQKISFDDLCTPCFNTIKNALDLIGKKIEGVSPDRKPRAKEKGLVVPTPSPLPPVAPGKLR